MNGNLVIISSPSGGGKGTLIREVLKTVPDIGYSVSLTTRRPRPGEIEGVHYHFVSRHEFESYAKNGGFLEFAEVHGNLYGTSLEETKKRTADGRDVILEIDVQGAKQVMAKLPGALSVFILPPSFEVLRGRLTSRATESSGDLELRLRNSFDEVRQFGMFNFVVVNDDVAAASTSLASIIIADRLRPDRQAKAIQSILDSFDTAKLSTTGD